MEMRKYTFRLYPNQAQSDELLRILRLHQTLYNAALEERIDAYKRFGKKINYNDQQASLTIIRADDDAYRTLCCKSERMTLRRLDKAMSAFFRRVRRGETPGFPRFKSLSRFPSFELPASGSWSVNCHPTKSKATFTLKGVGKIQAKGKARVWGMLKTSQVMHRHGKWWLSVTVACEPTRTVKSTKACGIDWGIANLLTITESLDTCEHVPNPRYYQSDKHKLTQLQQRVSRKKRGSKNWRKACKRLTTFRRKQANQRKDHHHQLSADIAQNYALVAMEKLKIKNMSQSAKGTPEKPGKNVKAKSGLNREILDTAPAMLMGMIRYKVEETGGEFVETPTTKLKPSQRCPQCDHASKRNRPSQAVFCCVQCGFENHADVVGGYNSLAWALGMSSIARPKGEVMPDNEPGTGQEYKNSKPLLSAA